MNKTKRIYNLDLLRILACFMVIVIHVAGYHWSKTPYNTFNFNVYNLYDSLVRSAVPIFVMISGVFFLSPTKNLEISKLYKKNILKLIVIYIFWSIVHYIYYFYTNDVSFSFSGLVHYLIKSVIHFWYIPMIIGLYIISPLVRQITVNSDKKLFRYFLFCFMFGCFIYTITFCNFIPHINVITSVINKLPINIICQFYSYFILGYFLYNYDISKRLEKAIYILAIISVGCCAFLTYYSSSFAGKNIINFYSEFSIFTFLEAVALFLFFKNKYFISENIYSDKIANLAECTLGIYIIHLLVIHFLFRFDIIRVTDFNPILSVPVISVIVFIICFIITSVLRKLRFIRQWLL